MKKNRLPLLTLLILLLSFPLTAPAIHFEETLGLKKVYVIPTSDHLDLYLNQYIKHHEKTSAGLSLAVFTRDTIIHESYHGHANKESNTLVDSTTVMEWGSATKILVWVSIMQLVERGELSLTEDITKYLPEDFLTRLRHDTPLTIYNLMHHNAGWEDTMIELYVANDGDISDLEATLRRTEPRQVYEPGEFTAYSNWGVALAGYIVERVSEKPFYEYVRENIFDVLGMKHTALNADLSDNPWVKEQRNNTLQYYSALGVKLDAPLIYISLYPAGMAVGTLPDFLRFAMALLPDETGKSPLFKNAQTLQDFTSTSLHYADGRTPRNSHGLWAVPYEVPIIGHGGNTLGCSAQLQICPSAGVGVVIMTNQAQESVYNYGLLPMIFGRYQTVRSSMPDVAEMEGIYFSTKGIFGGMMKWFQLTGMMPFLKSADNMLSYLPMMSAEQIEPYTYDFNLMGMKLPLQASVSDQRTMMSIPMWDYVKTSWASVIFKIATLVLFLFSVFFALISLTCTIIRRIKRRLPQAFEKLRLLNDISVILCFVNFIILAQSFAAYMGMGLFFGTYSSVLIQGILFIILALIPVVFTTMWILGLQKVKINKRQKCWLLLSSIAGLTMTFNVIFWNWFMI